MSPFRLRYLVAIGVSALLALVTGLVAGFASGAAVPDPRAQDVSGTGLGEASFPVPDNRVQLRTLAEQRQLRLGSAVNMDAMADPAYRTVLAEEFNAVTAENAMKWSAIEPAPGRYDRRAADQLIAFATENGQDVYGHTLVWHKQVPAWVRDGAYPTADLRALLRNHIEDQVGYFRGRVWAWDVVNEALNEDGSFRKSLWLERLGPDYLADAFRWARAADPDARLFLNDFGIEGINAKSDALYKLVIQLLAEGVPIDGIGFQMHWTLDPLPASFVENLQRFTALGLDVAVTELDVRVQGPLNADKLQQQAVLYHEAVAACLAVARCVSMTVWGFTDAYSWVPDAYPGSGAATMLDDQFEPKPAYTAVAQALAGPD